MRLSCKTLTEAGALKNLALFLFEEDRRLPSEALGGLKNIVEVLLSRGQFKASALAELAWPTEQGWIFLLGLGPRDKFSPAVFLEAAAAAAKAAERRCSELNLLLPDTEKLAPAELLELAAEGSLLAGYRQTEFKSKPEPASVLKSLRFLSSQPIAGAPALLRRAQAAAEAVCLARSLGDCPPNLLYPETFVQRARELVKPLSLNLEALDEKALASRRLNLILAVGGGSARPPRLLSVRYEGRSSGQPIVLVGKGISFDSGGLSLKPSTSLEGMKTDMAGAASVLAVLLACARLKLPLKLTAVMPLAENMPDGRAARVGDVIFSRSGRSVEITNTDAEGRLVLAEALTWAGEMKPSLIIDMATLTGACTVALGDRCAGLFANDDELCGELLSAAAEKGEALWRLPLLDEYDDNLRSETADMVNAPGLPRGGAINAALFLRRFVPSALPWAHLDIAGPGRAAKATPSTTVGASGFGVRTLLRFLIKRAGGR